MVKVPGNPIKRGKEVGGAVRGVAGKAGAGGAAVVGRLTKTLRKGADVAQQGTNDAAEKLTKGLQESMRMLQEQNMKLAQGFFQDSTGTLQEQIKANRETLEGLTEQVPGGDEEPFKTLVSQLLEAYDQIESTLGEAAGQISEIDVSGLIEDASEDAEETAEDAEEDVEEKAEDATETAEDTADEATDEVEETADAATDTAEETADGATETAEGAVDEGAGDSENGASEDGESEGQDIKATKAAIKKAEELGVDLSEVKGTGSGGLVTIKDVVGAKG